MEFSPLIYVFKNLYREETRAALTDVKISANEIAPYSMEEIEGGRARITTLAPNFCACTQARPVSAWPEMPAGKPR
jgi:hypothetical protein